MAAYLIMAGVLGLTLFSIFWTTISYKIKANELGVDISWRQVLGQRLRNTMTVDILEAASLAIKENLNIDLVKLETHKLAGGDPLKVINEIIECKRRGQSLEFNLATALDLAGKVLRKTQQPIHSADI